LGPRGLFPMANEKPIESAGTAAGGRAAKRPFAGTHQASIKDIARLANVSHSTVSRALHNSPLVNPETAQRIQKLALETGYRPSLAARSLVTRQSQTVGVVVTTIADPFVSGVVQGIEDEADRTGYSVFLANSNADPEREVRVVHAFEERRVDGIIVTSSRVGALYIPHLSRMHVPIVLLNNQHPGEFVHSVMIDNVEASEEATRHLICLGHKHIGYIGDRYGHQSDTERFTGYRRALEKAGMIFEPELVAHGYGRAEEANEAVDRLFDQTLKPTAVFCYNDMTALGVMRRLRERGLRVPADVSVVGFDDLHFSEYLDPPLTTVRQPMPLMGRMAMETLLSLLDGEEIEQSRKVTGELMVRASTAPPKGSR